MRVRRDFIKIPLAVAAVAGLAFAALPSTAPKATLLNENRLNLADARARQYLARQMEKHFFGEGADAAAGYVPPPAA